ncbi:MAG: hypothetical protein ACREQK_19745 [Candidatus Binatia bacterium]
MLRSTGAFVLGLFLASPLWADYTLVLKNGRRIMVQSYREEGGMVKFQGLGGEIGIAKEQVRTILKDGESDSSDFVVPRTGDLPGTDGQKLAPASSAMERIGEKGRSAGAPPDIPLEDAWAKEARDYQGQLRTVTQEIESLKGRYLLAARGYAPDGKPPDSNEAIKAWTVEFSSKIKDSVKQPAAGYTPQEKELSDLREQIQSLEKRREQLLQEMNQRGLDANAVSGGPGQGR